MGGRPHHSRGQALLAPAGATAAALLLIACGGGEAAVDRSMAAADGEAAVAAPSRTLDPVRLLKEGKTLPVAISPDEALDKPASAADVTLTKLKQADRLSQGEYLDPEVADQGMTFVCLEFKVRNTGSAEFDTAPLTQARWTGKDGETLQVDQQIGGNCAELGLVEENLLTEPDPRPGEFVRGTTLLMVPDGQAGVLEFADALDHALFKVETAASR